MTVTLPSLRRKAKKLHLTVSLSRQRELWEWCQCGSDSESTRSTHVPLADITEGEFLCISSIDMAGYFVLFSIHRPRNMQTKVRWYEEPCPLYSSLCLFGFFPNSWTKSMNRMLDVGALRLQFCIQLWDSDFAYLGKISLFLNRVNTFWYASNYPYISSLSSTTVPGH